MITLPKRELRIVRHEIIDSEWDIIQPMLPNMPRGVPHVDDRRVLSAAHR